ncbi:hypothetical protein ACPYPG_02465 [Streptomyces sp. FR-108]|uniref:hypothetical protein n=1 Tax=Streptomyces sp. FR-108 TaxID=3416665 RepID=UPI003CEF3E10
MTQVRPVRERVSGVSAERIACRASEPRPRGRARVADMARVAADRGVVDPPRGRAAPAERLDVYRRSAPGATARAAVRFPLRKRLPLPLFARLPYGAPVDSVVSPLPARPTAELGLPRPAVAENQRVGPLGSALTSAARWAVRPPPPAATAPNATATERALETATETAVEIAAAAG